MKQDRSRIGFIISALLILYFLTRLLNIHPMGEYFDYDEGTYLMMARLINHGHLPYRDVFAVHPPLYYYLLALWLGIFGDSYITGRLLSVFLGLISIALAYLIGKELKNWMFGAIFASLLVFDPLMIYMNSRVLHETVIELFTLLALYFFVKYFKTDNLRHAYASLFWAGLGSTAKFTIIPFLIALYITIILSLNDKSWHYFKGMINSIFTSKQVFIVLLTYTIATLAVISIVVAYPMHIIRLLVIVPGIHAVNLVGHKYTAAFFLLFWGILTVYILDISYVHKMIETIRILLKNWRVELKLGLTVLAAKALVEIPFGIFISGNYLSQTYLSQGGRYLPFLGFFSLMNKIFKNLDSDSPEFLVYLIPLILLSAWIILALSRGYKLKGEEHLNGLLLLNILMFLFLIPIPPNERFIYSLFLVAYLAPLYALFSMRIPKKKLITGLTISLLIFSAVDYGMLINYPAGRLKLAWGEHTDEMRHDLQTYLGNNKPRLCMSVNPMNAYYLHLNIDPYLLDTFGLAYLKRENPKFILERMKNGNITCAILSTWMYAIMQKDKTLKAVYDLIQNYSLIKGTLRFSESYSTGEVLEFFTLDKANRNLSISTHYGKLYFWLNGVKIGKLYLKRKNTSFDERTLLELKKGNSSTYTMRSWSRNKTEIKTYILLKDSSVRIEIPRNITAVFEFSGIAVKKNGEPLTAGETVSTVYLYTQNLRLIISSGCIQLDRKKLLIKGYEILLKYGGG